MKPEPEPEKLAEPYTLTAYIENPHRPDDGGFSVPLPTTKDELSYFLNGIGIKNVHEVTIGEVYSSHDDDNNLSYWLNEALKDMEGTKSIDELNYLAVKLQAMTEEQRDIFGANLQSKQYTDSLAAMINLAENLDCYYLQPAYDAETYGEFLITMQQDDPEGCFERLEKSTNEDDRAFAKYIKRLEDCCDFAAYAKMRAKEEGGLFTDYGYMMPEKEVREAYRGVQDIPQEHRISKPTLMETLAQNAQKSREQFGDPAPDIPKDKGDQSL